MYLPGGLLFVVFLFFFLWIVVFFVIVFFVVVFLFFFLFLLIFVVEVVGDWIQMDGVRLGHFQFNFAFGAAQDFALLYFIFIHVNFGATIGAANHGTILRTVVTQGLQKQTLKPWNPNSRGGTQKIRDRHRPSYYITPIEKSNC